MTNNLRIGWRFAVDTAALMRGEFRGDSVVRSRGAEAVERALDLDLRLAEAYAAQGYVYTWIAHDSAAADQAFARAIQLNPRFPTAWQWRGEHLSDWGHPEAGIPYLEEAHRLDPL